MSFLLNTLLAVSLAASSFASPLSTIPHELPRSHAFSYAPLVAEHHPHGSVNNSYIVMFKEDVAPALMANHLNFLQGVEEEHPLMGDLDAGLRHVYDGHVKGYAGKFSSDTVHRIRQMPEVDYIEQDQIVRTLEIAEPIEVDGTSLKTQKQAPWGLARISHRAKLSFGTFTKYEYDSQGGEGVDVYVIDTGINVDHAEFEGRAHWGKTVPLNDEDVDANGHGTHCAGTIASRAYGVAKAAHVIAVKVLGSNGSGTMSDVMSGVVWTVEQAVAKAQAAANEFKKTGKTAHKGSVANMSLGGGKSKALDQTLNRAVDRGVHFAVAAGNDNKDACNNSPAAAEKAVTVGASTLGDERAYFSNHGPCVDVFAPGLNVRSTYIGGKEATAVLSGTSMASPHTAGLLAYLLSLYPSIRFNPDVTPDFSSLFQEQPAPSFGSVYSFAYSVLPSWVASFLPPPELIVDVAPVPPSPPTITPEQLKRALLTLATEDALSGVLPSGTPNLLIFNNATTA